MATQEKNQLGDGSDNYAGAAKQAANAAKSAKEAGKTAAKETAKKGAEATSRAAAATVKASVCLLIALLLNSKLLRIVYNIPYIETFLNISCFFGLYSPSILVSFIPFPLLINVLTSNGINSRLISIPEILHSCFLSVEL